MNFSILLAVVVSATLVHAAPVKSKKHSTTKATNVVAPSLREQALNESALSAKSVQSTKATEVQVNSAYLQLQDPRPQIITRTYKYNLGIQLSRWNPQGQTQLPAGTSYDLASAGNTVLPTVSFGFQRELTYQADYTLDWGISLLGGYSSQTVNFELPSGYEISDSRLNSTLLKAQIPVQVKLANLKDFSGTITPQIGAINYTQSGVDPLANFSKQTTFAAMGFAVAYHVDENMAFNLETIANTDLGKQNVKIQSSQFNVGTQVVW